MTSDPHRSARYTREPTTEERHRAELAAQRRAKAARSGNQPEPPTHSSLYLIGAGAIAAALAPVLWRRVMCSQTHPVRLDAAGYIHVSADAVTAPLLGSRIVRAACVRVWGHDGGCRFRLPGGHILTFQSHGDTVAIPFK